MLSVSVKEDLKNTGLVGDFFQESGGNFGYIKDWIKKKKKRGKLGGLSREIHSIDP